MDAQTHSSALEVCNFAASPIFAVALCGFIVFGNGSNAGGKKNPSEENPNGKKLMTLEQAASAAAYM